MQVSRKFVGWCSLAAVGLVVGAVLIQRPRPNETEVEVASVSPAQETAPEEAVARSGSVEKEAWLEDARMPEYFFSDPSPVPNGGLVIEERSLWWGEVWETDERIGRTLLLKNPTDRDLHLVFALYPSGFWVERKPITVPAGGEFSLPVVLVASTRSSASDEPFVVMNKKFAPAIKEYPGRHPGWAVHCHVTRAMKVEEQTSDEQFVVTPLQPLGAVTAAIDGRTSGVTVDGPDEANRYLVSVDREALRQMAGQRSSTHLLIRGHLPFGAITDRSFGISLSR